MGDDWEDVQRYSNMMNTLNNYINTPILSEEEWKNVIDSLSYGVTGSGPVGPIGPVGPVGMTAEERLKELEEEAREWDRKNGMIYGVDMAAEPVEVDPVKEHILKTLKELGR